MVEFHGFYPMTTGDGSPSLSVGTGGEAMHSHQGAYSETRSIYLSAFESVKGRVPQLRVLSVGFGLGYIEAFLAAWSISEKVPVVELQSFESVEPLYEAFHLSLDSSDNPLFSSHRWIFEKVCEDFLLSFDDLKQCLKNWKEQKVWTQSGDIQSHSLLGPFHVVLYDPFSQNTNSELWSKTFLQQVLDRCDPTCVFSSYAATSDLKRCLKKNQFFFKKKTPGFAGKRERTFASRGLL